MSAIAAPADLGVEREREGLRLTPIEGWLTLVLVCLMAAIVSISIDDGAWILGRGNLTDFLMPVSIAGVLVSFGGVKLGWSRRATHLAGAALAALVIPVVSASLLPHSPTASVIELYRLAARVVLSVWTDFAVLHRVTTQEYGHYMLVFGLVAWGTGQYAGYAVFGHRRPFDAALVLGLILLGSMALNEHDQLVLLVPFTVCALLLMNRTHALDERSRWLRSRLGDPGSVRTAYLRGGAAFVALAVAGSVVLTATARSAPLQAVFADLPQRLVDITHEFQRFLPTGGSNRSIGAMAFGSTLPIANRWGSQDGTAFTVTVPAGETERFYWRAVTYSSFDLNAWSFGSTRGSNKAANAPLLKGEADDPAQLTGRRQVTLTIRPDVYRGEVILAPQTILGIDRASTINVIGAGGYFASVSASGGGPYTVTSLVPTLGDEPGGLTKNRLRAAGTDYPAEIRSIFLDTPTGALGPEATALLEKIQGQVAGKTAYDTASWLVDFFRNPANFTYDTDLRSAPCDGLSTVECFAKVKRGFCQWYATTMTIFLRELGIPARYVEGFLPGSRANGVETVQYSSAHAWVEAYFPHYGWVEFDPTGGGVARDVPLPSGQPVPESTLDPNASFAPINEPAPGDETGAGAGSGGSDVSDSPVPYVVLTLLLAAGLLLVVVRISLRRPAGEVSPDQAWGGIVGLARRLGLAPRPAQTVYEYAGMLGDVMPTTRPELATVATAKVEVAYGRATLGRDRLRAVAEAQRRIRLGLLRFAIRGRVRMPRRRSGR